MCGQAGLHRRTARPIPKLDQLADELLLAIESRGRDATGFMTLLENGKVQLEKYPITASHFVATRGRMHKKAKTVLLHTRFATVGVKRDPRNAHPVASGKVAAVHNGTIRNADEVFRTFNLPRIGTVDSEVIPALIDHAGWDQAVASLGLLYGGAATAIVHTDHPDEVILARLRMYPMVYGSTRDIVIWASTAQAIERAWWATYGKRFPGKIERMAEGTYVLINGKVIPGKLDLAEPPAPTWYRPTSERRASWPKPSKRAQKRAKRNGAGAGQMKRAASPDAGPYVNYPRETAEWDYTDEEAIQSLMRSGCSRADAEGIIYGCEEDDADEWTLDDFLDRTPLDPYEGMSPATRAFYALENDED